MNFNPFKKKKEEQTIQGSGYGSNYASNPVGSSSVFANSLMKGNGVPSITGQSLNIPSFSQKQEQIKQLTNQSPIQGSGNSSAYASNPSNYKAPSAPQVEQKQQQSSVPSYMAGYQNLADQKKALLNKQNQQGTDYYNKSYDERNRLLQESIPSLQQQFARTQGNVQKGIDLQQQSAEYAKQNAEDEWGTSQRLAAQTRGESEARNRNKFAALGTTSSLGAGSYGQAQENVESDFNRFTQEGLRGKEQNMFEIDKALQEYEIDAQTNLDELDMQLTNTIKEIQSSITMNGLDKQNALDDLYSQYENAVLGVEEGMQGIYKEYYDAQAVSSASSLSEQFMMTGVPQTEADFRYQTENYKAFQPATSGKKTEKQMAYEAAGNIAQNALAKLNSGNVKSGFGQKILGQSGEKWGTNSNEQQAYRSDIAAMRTTVQNALLGANMSPAEMEQIMSAIPQFNDNIDIAKSKLNSLINNLPIMAGSGQEVAGGLSEDQIQQILGSL